MSFFRHLINAIAFQHLERTRRRVIFYSEGGHDWPHLEGLLRACLAEITGAIVYLSSSDDDPGLTMTAPNLHCYGIGGGRIRDWLFEHIDVDVMVLTIPDIDNFQVKRSRHDVHYVYVQHSLVSLHMVYRLGAFDHYDTVFCAGPHHREELRTMERVYATGAKILVDHGYARLDQIVADRLTRPRLVNSDRPLHVLIAPSWGQNCIIESMGEDIIDILLAAGMQATLRPHPQTLRTSPATIQNIRDLFLGHPLFKMDFDVVGEESLHRSDVMISDWSGVAIEYALGLEKPVVFIDLPRKVNNKTYHRVGLEPLEVSIREKVGIVIPSDDLAGLPGTIQRLVAESPQCNDIGSLRNELVFNLGCQDDVGARYIAALLGE